MYGKTKQTCVPSDAQAKEKLALYVYEYLLHVGAQKAAQMFLNEIRWEKNITLGEPPGFLHSWWCVFWDLYCAAPERRDSCQHSNEAKAFYDYGAANMMQSNMPIGAAFPPNGPGGGPPPIDPMRMRMSHHMPPHGHPHHMGPVPPQLRHPGVGGVGGCPPMVRPFSPPVVQHQQQQHPQGMHPQGGVPPPSPHDNIHPQGGNMPPQQSNNIQMNEGVPTMMTSSNNDQSWGCSPNMPPQQHAAMLSRGGDMSQGGGPPTSNQNNQNFTGLQGPSQLNHPDQIPCSVAMAGGHGGQPMIGGGGGNNGGGPSQQSMGFSSGQSQQTPPMSSAHFVENSSNVNNMNQHIGDPQFKQRRMSDEPSNSAFSGNSSIGSPIVHGPLAPMYNMMNKVGLPGPSLAKQQGSGPCGVTNVSEQMLNVGMSDVKIEKNCGPVDGDQEKGSICSSPSSRNISTPNNSSSCNNNRSNTNNSNVGGVGIKKEELTTPTTSHQSDLIHESMIKNESQAYNKQGADDEEPNHAETTGGNVGGCSINTGIDSDMVQPSFTHQSPSTIKQEGGCVDLGGIGGAGLPISGQSSESQF